MDPLILEAIARLKRSQPRNADTILVCTALEAALYRKEAAKVKFDRNRYQRDYMRKWRARRRSKAFTG
jgi:hypothetical protein